ncbi:MAG: DUF4124 domain-containing protein, partial [Xanthomonadales bacterium]|nr:DUF4124 domain-containing protein [Xanthomonadales bacterium]
ASSIFKCTGPDGSVSYQQAPCESGSQQETPVVSEAPTLTAEERFKAAAYEAGLSPSEARRLLESPGTSDASRGIPEPADRTHSESQQVRQPTGRNAAFKCVRPDGSFYFSIDPCGTSVVRGPRTTVPRNWVNDRVEGSPGAVMVAPDIAINPTTGQPIHLVPQAPTVTRQRKWNVADTQSVVDRDDACDAAKEERNDRRRANPDLSFQERERLDDQVWGMCHSTRSSGR